MTTTLEHVSSLGRRERHAHAVPTIPFLRVAGIELRKMFDTRSGFWLLMSIAITSLLATAAVIIFAPDSAITYGTFGAAVGIPMSILLPVIAILSVTSEWSQRTGLTTFTLVPNRSRIIVAKLLGAILVGVASMIVAMGIGALGNLAGAAITGVDIVWQTSARELAYIVLANVLGLLIGFMLGVLIRNSAAAIVGYFVYSFVVPTLTGLLAATQTWFADVQKWVDFQFNQTSLFEGTALTGDQWGQLAVSGLIWLVLPLVVGLWQLMRAEVK